MMERSKNDEVFKSDEIVQKCLTVLKKSNSLKNDQSSQNFQGSEKSLVLLNMLSSRKNVEPFEDFQAVQKSLVACKKFRWSKKVEVVKRFSFSAKFFELQICPTTLKILQAFKSLKFPKTFGGSKIVVESEKFLTLSGGFQGKYDEVAKYFRCNLLGVPKNFTFRESLVAANISNKKNKNDSFKS